MFFFGHIGITVGAVDAVNKRFNTKVDLRKVAVLALLPDLIDKPLGLLYPNVFENHTRLFGHHALFSIFLFVLFWSLRRRIRHWIILWCAFFGHMILDRFWSYGVENFFWPLLGDPKQLNPNMTERWGHALLEFYNLGGEILGFIVLAVILAPKLTRRFK